jgi:hypothetical protein
MYYVGSIRLRVEASLAGARLNYPATSADLVVLRIIYPCLKFAFTLVTVSLLYH